MSGRFLQGLLEGSLQGANCCIATNFVPHFVSRTGTSGREVGQREAMGAADRFSQAKTQALQIFLAQFHNIIVEENTR